MATSHDYETNMGPDKGNSFQKIEFVNENEFNKNVRERLANNKAIFGPKRKTCLVCKEKQIDFKREQRFQTRVCLSILCNTVSNLCHVKY